MIIAKTRVTQPSRIFFVSIVLAAMLMFSGCNGDDVTGPEGHGVEEVIMSQESVEIAVGEEVEVSAYLLNADGDTVDTSNLDIEWGWWSTNDEVFSIEYEGTLGGPATGTIIGHSPGEEYCIVEVTILEGSSNFTGRDSLRVLLF